MVDLLALLREAYERVWRIERIMREREVRICG